MMSPAVVKHLNELRGRLLWAFFVMAIAITGLYLVKGEVLGFLLRPLMNGTNAPAQIVFSSVPELFFVYLKISTWGGVFITMPFLLFQIWKFLAPGLYEYERKWVAPMLAAVPVLFYTGGVFAYYVVLPLALNFFLGFRQEGVSAMPNVGEYLGILFNFSFAFGLAFNLPVVLLLFVKVGILSIERLQSMRRFAIVAIFIFSALMTPPDPFSQIFLAIPLIMLYELAIFFGRWMMSDQAMRKGLGVKRM